MGEVMGRTILQMDEPEHRLHRASGVTDLPVQGARAVGGATSSSGWSMNSIDGFACGRGEADLVQELTFNFPVQVIAQILGLPRARLPPIFQRWAIEITSVAANWERGSAASAALRDYFADVLAERRRHPAEDP